MDLGQYKYVQFQNQEGNVMGQPGVFVPDSSFVDQRLAPPVYSQPSTSSDFPVMNFPLSSSYANNFPLAPAFNAPPIPGCLQGFGYPEQPPSCPLGTKRKTSSPPPVALKKHITEEKMALHMSRLHISSQTPTATMEEAPARERRLYLCDEMRKLQCENIIPSQILRTTQKPCTALIPWTPPIARPLSSKENNNNEGEPNNYNLQQSGSSSTGMDMES